MMNESDLLRGLEITKNIMTENGDDENARGENVFEMKNWVIWLN